MGRVGTEPAGTGSGRWVRPAQADDAGLVEEILTEAARWTAERGVPAPWPVPYPRANFLPRLLRGEVYLAQAADGPSVATVTLQWDDVPFWGEQPPIAGYVHRLAVRPAHRGQGWGRWLLEWAALRCRAAGRGLLRLDCVQANRALCAYYERLGFVFERSVEAGGFRCALFERPLTAARDGRPSSP